MSFKSNLGQNGAPTGGTPAAGAPSGGAPANGANGSVNQGGISSVFPGAFPVGVPTAGVCPPGYLAAPSAIVPGGYTCVRAPGAYTVPIVMAGRR